MKYVFYTTFFGAIAAFVYTTSFVYKNQLAHILSADILIAYQNKKGISDTLQKKDKNSDVRLVQELLSLTDVDFKKEYITGYFGPITESFVSNFQKNNNLPITGFIDLQTKEFIDTLFLNDLCPSRTENTLSNSILFNVNKKNKLPIDYVPPQLVIVPDSLKTTRLVCLQKDTLSYLEKMIQDAERDGVHIYVTSGFRRENIQEYLYGFWGIIMGEQVDKEVALPGYSEHQLGTTIDVTGLSNGLENVDPKFEYTIEFRWLLHNAHKYGFVMSYTKNTDHITGYGYEPWHWRFVGVEHARNILRQNITVHEYLERLNSRRR